MVESARDKPDHWQWIDDADRQDRQHAGLEVALGSVLGHHRYHVGGTDDRAVEPA